MSTIDFQTIGETRRATLANGYQPIRVKTGDKRPVTSSWQNGEQLAALMNVTSDTANTGMLCLGMRVVDIDSDDEHVVKQIISLVAAHLPKCPLIRRRTNSPRVALVYKAKQGQPPKKALSGEHGKVEILGAGQQVVIYGTHPTGAKIEWVKNRSPSTIALGELPLVSETKIERFLEECGPIIAAARITSRGAHGLPRTTPVTLQGNQSPAAILDGANDLSGGLEPIHWFSFLPPEKMQDLVGRCLNAIDNKTSDPRDRWLRVIFAVADAGQCGCPSAEHLALSWSKRGRSWTSDREFYGVWNGYKPGAITVGTLLHEAQRAGLDLSPWNAAPNNTLQSPTQSAGLITSKSIAVSDLPQLPPKRKWLHGTDVMRGATSLLVAPGGRGKSTWLLTLAMACASGKSLLGSKVFGGPLQVLFISTEEATNEIALRLRAAMQHYGLTDADLVQLRVIGADLLSLSLMSVQRGQPTLNDDGWSALTNELHSTNPDLVLLDPLVAMMGGVSLNDNSASALMMSKFVQVAAQRNMAFVIAHHAAKNREATSAEAAMGAASLVNLSRIALSIEPLTEGDASKIGIAPWNAKSFFRIVGTKQNLSPPTSADRWFQLVPVEFQNAEPPTYPNGDQVAVVQPYTPNPAGALFPAPLISAVLTAISNSHPPLSPSGRGNTSAIPVIGNAIAPFRGNVVSTIEAKSVLDYLIRTGQVISQQIQVPRPGRGPYQRMGLVVVSTPTVSPQSQVTP